MQATFHFNGALNDFLPLDGRGLSIRCTFNTGQSVKHLIESLGVPHTEIQRILVAGNPVDFSYQVADEDRVEVYPAETVQLQAGGSGFILDNHLGRLALYLRMLGFDALYRNDFHDIDLARLSSQEGRVLLTRDRRLLMRVQVTQGYWVRSKIPRQQLLEVVQRFNLRDGIVPFSRCMRCNGTLEPVSKEAVLDRLEPLTRLYYDEFRICSDCDQVYWKGSHYERMQRFIDQTFQGRAAMPDEEHPLLPPGLLSITGVTPALLGSVFAAAAELYRIGPWKRLAGETPIEVRCPQQAPPRLVVMLGAGGQAFGLCAYDSAADLRMAQESADPLETAGGLNWLALSYDSDDFMAVEDLAAVGRFGWPVAGEEAYPAIARLGSPGPELHSPALDDLRWLDGALRGLGDYFTHHLELDERSRLVPYQAVLRVETSDGPVELALRIPAG